MKKAEISVTVVIPTLNEEKNLGDLLWELRHLGYHDILIVDGNSHDKTVEVAKEFGVDVIFQNGRGKGDALRRAFNYSHLDGDVVVPSVWVCLGVYSMSELKVSGEEWSYVLSGDQIPVPKWEIL